MATCFKCGHELPARERIFRATRCENCGADARVCRNCVFYEPGSHWDCRETIPEAVRDKERANFCEYFRVATHGGVQAPHSPGDQESPGGGARDKFDSLFGDS